MRNITMDVLLSTEREVPLDRRGVPHKLCDTVPTYSAVYHRMLYDMKQNSMFHFKNTHTNTHRNTNLHTQKYKPALV